MAGPLIPIIAVMTAIAKVGLKEATKKYGKTAVNQAKKLNKMKEKVLDAEDKAADYYHRGNKARVTRTRNSLSKEVNKVLGSDANDLDRIKLHTLLQDSAGKFNKGGIVDYRKTGLFR